MPNITIERPHEWGNQTDYINIFIDGKKAGPIGYAETMSFQVTPGKHKVVATKMKSGKSKPLEVDLNENENKIIKLSTYKYWFLIPLAFIVLLTIIFFTLISVFHFESYILMVVFIALPIPLYSVTFGRINNLKLEEVK